MSETLAGSGACEVDSIARIGQDKARPVMAHSLAMSASGTEAARSVRRCCTNRKWNEVRKFLQEASKT